MMLLYFSSLNKTIKHCTNIIVDVYHCWFPLPAHKVKGDVIPVMSPSPTDVPDPPTQPTYALLHAIYGLIIAILVILVVLLWIRRICVHNKEEETSSVRPFGGLSKGNFVNILPLITYLFSVNWLITLIVQLKVKFQECIEF